MVTYPKVRNTGCRLNSKLGCRSTQGHQARIIPAQFVRPFVKANKNDFNDAAAIAEAVTRPTMRFVPVKNREQLDLQALHRVRDRLVHDRTAVVNQIRAFLLENDLPLRTGRVHLRRELPSVLEDAENGVSMRLRALLARLWRHWQWLEEQIQEISRELEAIARSRDDCRRLLTVVSTIFRTFVIGVAPVFLHAAE